MKTNNSTFIERGKTCFTKEQFIELLKMWLVTTENTIGDTVNNSRNTAWLFLQIDNRKYYINADTTRQGIETFVKNHTNNYPWMIIKNNRGNFKKVTNDRNGNAIPYLYFYSMISGQRIV
jgi:hypothetical protein